MEDKQT